MRAIVPAILIPAVCLSLAADTTGRIRGKVIDKAGKPVPGVTVKMKRVDTNWTKELKYDPAKGTFMQIGLDPKEYTITFEAEGYQPQSFSIALKLSGEFTFREKPNDPVQTLDVTLLTLNEAREEALKKGGATASQSEIAADTASVTFNSAIEFYNNRQFTEALPLVEKAYGDFKDSLEKSKDDKEKFEITEKLKTAERVYGIVLFEVGKADETKKGDLWKKAEPMLVSALARNSQDMRLLYSLRDIAQGKKDAEAEKKYQAEIDKIEGPRPELAYNKGVEAFNAGRNDEARANLMRAISIDPKFAESYYLLAMVEFGMNNLKATKENLQKYLELAPTGKNAPTAKEMLNDPSLKHIK